MEIYVVQPGDSIELIAKKYSISVERLISDNGLTNPYTLVSGQTIVILYPKKSYTVMPGDTLASIANTNGISIMELTRNNPFLYDRNYIYPGESLVINYNSDKNIVVNGFAYTFINLDILKRALPYLTYLSIFNYRIAENTKITNYGNDTDLIKIAKDYNTIPLLMISAFSQTGELDLDYIYQLLLNENKQDKLVNDMLQIVKSKNYSGINAIISHITESNQNLYLNVLTKLSKALKKEGYLFILTIEPNLQKSNDQVVYEKLDYQSISKIVDRIVFFQNLWVINRQPPAPVSDISLIRNFIQYVTSIIPPNMISIGEPLLGYDWLLPFTPGLSYANSLSLDSAITLAYNQQVAIQFDDESQTPYFNYITSNVGFPENHVVWFIDARSIKALDDVIAEYDLAGSGIWNLMIYNQQLWSIINARFYIVKMPII
ncbi:LysM peptidoglycan-binding domain-containing protein [Anaeromicropila herbilytica]|uniref:Germination protein n=1 Tax=Anaeromicropila herbilytica TaxID=2785025 RepID=A0A7R7EN02_9FIRM|nr:LysM peptidoglycan-binding domain-containing protein [Anaeromicropila herbilytica]BCN31845.1 germination protein [Anaeromicropila herbilytica]